VPKSALGSVRGMCSNAPPRGPIQDHLGAVEETLNALLDPEADHLCDAGRYKRGLRASELVDCRPHVMLTQLPPGNVTERSQ
jgi:hypothetical protein